MKKTKANMGKMIQNYSKEDTNAVCSTKQIFLLESKLFPWILISLTLGLFTVYV